MDQRYENILARLDIRLGKLEQKITELEKRRYINDECSHVLPFGSLECMKCGQVLDD